MPTLRLALGQIDTTVGDLDGNAAIIRARTREAVAAGADLIAFPEMALTGYPVEDLVLRPSFRAASCAALDRLALELAADALTEGRPEIPVVVGYLDEDGGPRDSSALLYRGAVQARYHKHHLPNYGVFDERRYFVPGEEFVLVDLLGVAVALTVCEDVWQDGGPFAGARAAGAGLVININGSPYERHKDDARLDLLRRRAAEAGAAVLYVNAVGGQDELVFDGDSLIVGADGELLARAPQYVEGVFCCDVVLPDADGEDSTQVPQPSSVAGMALRRLTVPDLAAPRQRPVTLVGECAEQLPDEAEVWGALVTGLRDYVDKNRFASVVIAMSGGIDSAVVAALAADAIGGQRVHGVSLPSAYSSGHSRTDAEDLAERIGAHFRTIPIAPMVDAFVHSLGLTGLAEENVQARVRGTTLMALSNQEGHLVLATGNKSELAVGYSTIYGDAVGGFAPIKDVPKTLVWRLARWRNDAATKDGQTPPIPENSITKPPSAELRPGQLDSDSLPDYELLDAILARYVDGDEGVTEIVASGYPSEVVQRIAQLTDRAEWKRRQYPPGPKISFKAFGKDRRLPITNHWREQA